MKPNNKSKPKKKKKLSKAKLELLYRNPKKKSKKKKQKNKSKAKPANKKSKSKKNIKRDHNPKSRTSIVEYNNGYPVLEGMSISGKPMKKGSFKKRRNGEKGGFVYKTPSLGGKPIY